MRGQIHQSVRTRGEPRRCNPPVNNKRPERSSLFVLIDHFAKVNKNDALRGNRWLAGVDEDANYLFQIPAATPKNPPQQRKRDRDRAERMRLAGGPMPSLREKAYAFARQRTIVRTSDFTAIGIPRHYLAWMCEEGWLVREGYGLYRAAEREAA